jgi:glycolate oxidase FAD binding subunit
VIVYDPRLDGLITLNLGILASLLVFLQKFMLNNIGISSDSGAKPTDAIAPILAPLLGEGGFCLWDLSAETRSPITQALGTNPSPSGIAYPCTVAELADIITHSDRHGWGILPYGSGSKLNWGGIGKNIQLAISTQRLNQIVDHAVGDLTVTVEAGVKFSDLQALLASTGQFLPLDPAYPQEATIGGIIATADTGSLRHRYGGVRDLLLGITFVRADGQIAKAGGRVVKNVAGYDLMKLFTGSYGSLGILTEVTLRVYPIPEASGTVVLTGKVEAIASITKTLLASSLTPHAADLLSPAVVAQLGIGEGMGLCVRFQSITDSVKQQAAQTLEMGTQLGLQGNLYLEDEAHLWQRLPEPIFAASHKPAIICKIGVSLTAATTTLTQLEALTSGPTIGLIHAGSGLGLLRLEPTVSADTILQMRQICQEHNGFLTVLEAPISLKEQLDVWGYSGNALELMRGIKQKFDPKSLLSSHRFVGGI